MLKIKDSTSKQNLNYINATFWNNQKIKKILIDMKSIRNGIIYINDITVDEYNKIDKQLLPKSNASFVRQIRKLNKENYFDDLVEKVRVKKMSAKEMFEDLGYTYQESYFEEKLDEINYSKSGDYAPQIKFNLNHKCAMIYRQENKASWFDVKILQAINKQVEELSWNE